MGVRPAKARGMVALALMVGCSSSSAENPPGVEVVHDPRPLPEICVKYCDNARVHGCESAITLGSSCQDNCEWMPPGDEACHANWVSHTGCLADLSNLCDAALRDQQCLAAFCRMRRSCNLPDPRCR